MPDLKPEDIRIDTFTNASPGVSMRLIHEPSGMIVTACTGPDTSPSQYGLRKLLHEELKQKVREHLTERGHE